MNSLHAMTEGSMVEMLDSFTSDSQPTSPLPWYAKTSDNLGAVLCVTAAAGAQRVFSLLVVWMPGHLKWSELLLGRISCSMSEGVGVGGMGCIGKLWIDMTSSFYICIYAQGTAL